MEFNIQHPERQKLTAFKFEFLIELIKLKVLLILLLRLLTIGPQPVQAATAPIQTLRIPSGIIPFYSKHDGYPSFELWLKSLPYVVIWGF